MPGSSYPSQREKATRKGEIIKLSARDSEAIVSALLHPQPAGARLRQAAERYKRIMGDS
ncbi:MAG TPA: DUF1778 domain-containing protein [Ktedonobacterales bacterium]|nr:DUF1778 domain-containing protein [Ktedonobacterales bacterium]